MKSGLELIDGDNPEWTEVTSCQWQAIDSGENHHSGCYRQNR